MRQFLKEIGQNQVNPMKTDLDLVAQLIDGGNFQEAIFMCEKALLYQRDLETPDKELQKKLNELVKLAKDREFRAKHTARLQSAAREAAQTGEEERAVAS